jgi:sugar phosphate isomerase/epimerase
MIRTPLALRLEAVPGPDLRDALRAAARAGARGVILDAGGDLAPHRLGETARRDLRHELRTLELPLVALNLPTRRDLDTLDDLDDRLERADRACALAYELGTRLVLVRAGEVPPESDAPRRAAYRLALQGLGLRADRHGVRAAIEAESGPVPHLASLLDDLAVPTLAASVDPDAQESRGRDAAAALRAAGPHLAHAYAFTGSARGRADRYRPASPLASGFAWEEYLGALEDVDYRGHLTVWPPPSTPADTAFTAVATTLARF